MEVLENATVVSNSTSIVRRIFNTDIGKYLFLFFVAITLLSGIFTCAAIIATRRIPFAVKLLTCVTLVCNSLFLVVCIFAYAVGFSKEISASILIEFGRIFSVISWLAVTILSLERVFCLYYPFLYLRIGRNGAITKTVVGCIFLTLSVKLTVRYLLIPLVKQEEFDFIKATNNVHLNIYALAVCIFIITVCHIAIFLVVKKLIATIEANIVTGNQFVYRRHFVSTRNITCIIAVFQLVHVPLLISYSFLLAFKDDDTKNLIAVNLTAVCTLIMCAVNPVLYAWRFKECRFVMLRLIGRFCNIFDTRLETMRLEVYSISIRN